MGNEKELKWSESALGKLIDNHVLEIKDVEYVVVMLTTLKEQTYNELLLNYAKLPYSFLIAAAHGVDKDEDYVVAYMLKFTEEMHTAYMNSTLILFFNAFHFRVYQNGECITAYTKTPRSPGDKG